METVVWTVPFRSLKLRKVMVVVLYCLVLNLLTVLEIPLWKAKALCSTSFMLSSFWYPQMIFCLSD